MENYPNNSNNTLNDIKNQQEQSNDANAGDEQDSDSQHIPTFGVGGQTSHVIDPEFRQPAPPPSVPPSLFDPNPRGLFGSSFYTQQSQQPASSAPSYTATGSNIYSSSNLFITTPTTTSFGSMFASRDSSSISPSNNTNNNSNPSTTQSASNVGGGSSGGIPQLSFTMNSPATSFSDLAKRNNSTTSNLTTPASGTSTSTASMLQEYGPPPTSLSPTKSVSSDNSNAFGSTSRQTYNVGAISISKPSTITTSSSTFATTSANTPYIPPTSGQISHSSNHASTGSSKSIPAYSPPPAKPKSPPLDKIPSINKSAGEAILESAKNKSSSNKIPRRAEGHSTNDVYETMDLVSLQKEYRRLENDKFYYQRKRVEIEKVLNDMTRTTQGKNIELHPLFRSKREELKKCNNRSSETEENMRRVSDRLHAKFGHRIEPRVAAKSNPIKRVKMSTAAPAPRVDSNNGLSKVAKMSKLLFDFEDSKTWCETCDHHFESIKEFCNHLHNRDHIRAANKATKDTSIPWRIKRDPIDRRRTYQLIQSICSKVSSELGQTFTTTDLEKALYPNFENADRSSKERRIGRERSRFESDDQLFLMKGYNYLVPITGYYCKLCNRCLCDHTDVEQHLKGYEHTHKHVESIALNPDHEKKFRTKMQQSYKLQYSDEIEEEAQSSVKKGAVTSGNEHDGFRIPQYKKSTSHIVDEHEVVADKFANRPERSTIKSTASKQGRESSERESSPRIKSKRTFDTGIVPLGDTRKPSALKRLRNDNTSNAYSTLNRDKKKEGEAASRKADSINPSRSSPDEIVIISDDEHSMDKTDTADIHLDSGDPENPFPDLELRVLGNYCANILKDPRLASPCTVVLTKLDLEAHRDSLNDAATLWTRVNKMLAKREKGDKGGTRIDFREKRTAEAIYFNANDELVPIECDEDGKKSKPIKEEKPKISKLNDSEARANAPRNSKDGNDHTKKKDGVLGDKDKGKDNEDKGNKVGFESISDSDDSDTPKKAAINMSFIEDFFCEK